MSRPFKLYRLQQLDSQLDTLHNRFKEITNALTDDRELALAKQEATEADEELQKRRKALRAAENETQGQRIKIEQTESTLYGGKVRNPKELKDLEDEAAALKRYLAVLEDRQLERMLEEEEHSGIAGEKNANLEKARIREQSRVAELSQEQEKLEKDVLRLEEERKATESSIAAEDIAIYNQLRQKRRGVAVAKVVDRACAACGSTLNAMLLNAAHSPNQLNHCDNCGRILYTG